MFYKFVLHAKNNYCDIDTFLQGLSKSLIIFRFFITFETFTKFGYVFKKIESVTLFVKNNHCLTHRFYRDTLKCKYSVIPFHKEFADV